MPGASLAAHPAGKNLFPFLRARQPVLNRRKNQVNQWIPGSGAAVKKSKGSGQISAGCIYFCARGTVLQAKRSPVLKSLRFLTSHRMEVAVKKYVLALLMLLTTWCAAESKLLRHPSYHNGKVAFSYLGDIWVANEDGSNVQRLTVHRARDVYPRFSPDGKWIAFSSNRYGNYDVFVIPAEGGAAKQLTFHSAADIVVNWSPDSKRVLFQSSRGLMYPGIPNLYEVSIDGGLEHA